ncbi:MAG: hypothetical protein EBS36_00545 [Actinobacteria bacterium]|nr:hypothetical protein [Actinomycetota bacterium]NBY15184.1 hypothetical protein [Actinomycetota bacterium]
MDSTSDDSQIQPMPAEPTSWQSESSVRELAKKYPEYLKQYPEYRKLRSLGIFGLTTLISSPFIVLSPVLLALIMIPLTCGGYSSANESNCGAAALPWFLFFSIPAGIFAAIIGAIMMWVASARKSAFLRKIKAGL